MALELATALDYADPDTGKREHFDEGTQLSKLPKKLQDVAKEQDILRAHVTQPGEMDFEELYQRAVDAGVISITADELEAAVRAQERVKAEATGFGAPTAGPQATDIPAGDGGGMAAQPLNLKEEEEAAGMDFDEDGEVGSGDTEVEVEDDRPGGNADEGTWREYRLARGYTDEELEGLGRNALRDLDDR